MIPSGVYVLFPTELVDSVPDRIYVFLSRVGFLVWSSVEYFDSPVDHVGVSIILHPTRSQLEFPLGF